MKVVDRPITRRPSRCRESVTEAVVERIPVAVEDVEDSKSNSRSHRSAEGQSEFSIAKGRSGPLV